jgi:kynureninase
LDPEEYLVQIFPNPGQDHIDFSQFEHIFQSIGAEIALVFFPAVQYATGQALPIQEITRLAHRNGCLAGFDLAHAAGNVPLQLHAWEVDFAAWCGYKYLCGGPGNGAGIYAHERYVTSPDFMHLAGWWGNDPNIRFEMHPHFEPVLTAERFQLSNPAIFSLASMLAPLRLYHAASMPALRQKSIRLTGYLEFLLDQERGASNYKIITPRTPEGRGCQLSVRISGDAAVVAEELLGRGVVIDERPPDIIRIAPLPIYNTFHEVWRFSQILKEVLAGGASR